MAMIDRKSAMMGINPSEKISLIASISFMVLVVKCTDGCFIELREV